MMDARRSAAIAFARGMPADRSFHSLALHELDTAIANAADRALPAVERIHAVRTACKRLRALLRLVRTAFPVFEQENHAIRDAAAGLAAIRDAAVMDATLARLGKSSRIASAGLATAIATRAPSAEAEEGALLRFLGAAESIRRRAAGWALTAPSLSPLAKGLASTYQRAYADMEVAAESGRPRDFHEWRKQTKYLFYQLEFLRGLKLAAVPRLKSVEKLGDLLGRQHDLQVLRDFATGELAEDEAAPIARETDRAQASLARRCLKLADEVFVDKPKKWRARLERELRH